MVSDKSNKIFPLIPYIGFSFFIMLVLLTHSCDKDEAKYPEFIEALGIEANVDLFVENYVSEHSPGISILVRKQGDIFFRKSYGLANIETKLPFDSDTPVYLASVSKQFTAMSTMLLEEEGKLSYDDPITKHIIEAPAAWADIKIHHLLTHRSGIPDYLSDLRLYRPDLTNQDVLDELIKIEELEFDQGSQYQYSNSGYLLLAMITSRASSIPFHIYLDEKIFSPLEMNNSLVYDESKPILPSRAIGYLSNGQLNDYELLTLGDGGMFSSINDLDKWEQSFYKNVLINEITTEIAFTSHHSDGYGYGWGIDQMKGFDRQSHEGRLNGYSTFISRIPEKQFSVIILSNGTFEWIRALHDEIVQLYL